MPFPIVDKGFSATDFAAYAAGIVLTDWKPHFVVLHNTGAPRLALWHSVSGAQRMINLDHYYSDEEGWAGGPHLFVADDLIWVFNPLVKRGTHSPSWNAVSWGVEVVGDYDVEVLTDAVKGNMIAALTALDRKS